MKEKSLVEKMITVIIVAACFLPGCQNKKQVETLEVELDTSDMKLSVDYSMLEKVLEKTATGRRADTKEYRVNDLEEKLDLQLSLMAVCGPSVNPDLFPDELSKLVYWLNARTAWTIKFTAMIDEAWFKAPDSPSPRPGKFTLDGRKMALEDIDARISETGDYMHVIIAPGLRPLRAPIPREVFDVKKLDRQVREIFNSFIDDPDRFVIDVESKEILVPPVIWQHRNMLKQKYREKFEGTEDISLVTALLPMTSGSAHRRLQNALGYVCRERLLPP